MELRPNNTNETRSVALTKNNEFYPDFCLRCQDRKYNFAEVFLSFPFLNSFFLFDFFQIPLKNSMRLAIIYFPIFSQVVIKKGFIALALSIGWICQLLQVESILMKFQKLFT